MGTVIGTDCLRGDPQFTWHLGSTWHRRRLILVTFELVTIAACAGHSFAITNDIPEGESEDIEISLRRHMPDMTPSAMEHTPIMTRASCGMALM